MLVTFKFCLKNRVHFKIIQPLGTSTRSDFVLIPKAHFAIQFLSCSISLICPNFSSFKVGWGECRVIVPGSLTVWRAVAGTPLCLWSPGSVGREMEGVWRMKTDRSDRYGDYWLSSAHESLSLILRCQDGTDLYVP